MHEEDKVWILQSPKFPRISHSTRRVTQCRYFSLLHSYMTPAPEANLWIAIFLQRRNATFISSYQSSSGKTSSGYSSIFTRRQAEDILALHTVATKMKIKRALAIQQEDREFWVPRQLYSKFRSHNSSKKIVFDS